jgi:hypothetical protein
MKHKLKKLAALMGTALLGHQPTAGASPPPIESPPPDSHYNGGNDSFLSKMGDSATESKPTNPSRTTRQKASSDLAGVVQFSEENYRVSEGRYSEYVGVGIELTGECGPNSPTVSVSYASSDGTATSGEDYNSVNGTETVTYKNYKNRCYTSVNIPIIDDTEREDDETINLTLTDASNGIVIDQAVVTIIDDDGPGIIGIGIGASGSLSPFGTESSRSEIIFVGRKHCSSVSPQVSVSYATTNTGTAVLEEDYNAVNGIFNWETGDCSQKSFSVSIINDSVLEPDETVNVKLSNPTGGAKLTESDAVLTITDDDGPGIIGFYKYDTEKENLENRSKIRFEVIRDDFRSCGNGSPPVSVSYATTNIGTAVLEEDYNAVNGILNWEAGDCSNKYVSVPIINDSVPEEYDETVNVTLSNPTGGAELAESEAVLTIIDDDGSVIGFSQEKYKVGEGDGSAVITAERSQCVEGFLPEISVSTGKYTTNTSGGISSIFLGKFSWDKDECGPKTLDIPIVDDTEIEGNETIDLRLSFGFGYPGSSRNFQLGNRRTVLTIIDNESPEDAHPNLEISSNSHHFDAVTAGHNKSHSLTLKNTGNISLDIKTEITGADAADFNTPGCYRLSPSRECQIDISFIPLSAGEKQANLLITSETSFPITTPSLEVSLSGTATAPADCSPESITLTSAGNGPWDSPDTWNRSTSPTETDTVQIQNGHTITGVPVAQVKALCIEEGGVLESVDNEGTALEIYATDYFDNKGTIKGKEGAFLQPGASVYLSTGNGWWSGNPFHNKGSIIAGHGGEGRDGGSIRISGGVLTNTPNEDGSGGIIQAGNGGDLTETLSGKAGQGGGITMWGSDSLRHQGEIKMSAGKGGHCNPNATESQRGGDGGKVGLNANLQVHLQGTFLAGSGGEAGCDIKGQEGKIYIDPEVISLSGAHTKISGGDVVIYADDNVTLDLKNLSDTAITASGDITIAVGNGSTIDMRENTGTVFKAGGQVQFFADEIVTDEDVLLADIVEATDIVTGAGKILRDVTLIAPSQSVNEPETTIPISFTVANGSPATDTFTLTMIDSAGWTIDELPATVEIEGLGVANLVFNVTFPPTRGETNTITITATSQSDSSVSSTAEMPMSVATLAVEEEPEIPDIADEEPDIDEQPAVPDDEQSIPDVVTPTRDEAPDEELSVPEEIIPAIVSTVVVAPPTTRVSNCSTIDTTINKVCYNHRQVLKDVTLGEDAKLAGGELAGTIKNQGIISQVTILKEAVVSGGKFTGYIKNEGTMADFEFVGAQISGGTFSGNIFNLSPIGGIFKDVQLAPNTQITGGVIQGNIIGDCEAPARLENLTVKKNSHLSCVIIGNNVALASGITFQEVQLTAPTLLVSSNGYSKKGDDGVALADGITFQNLRLAANTYLKGGQLQGDIIGDINAPARLEKLEIKAGSHLVGVILGDGVKLAEGVTFGESVQFANNEQETTVPNDTTLPMPTLSDAIAITTQGEIINTEARFSGGILSQQSLVQTLTMRLSEPVDISGRIELDPIHDKQVIDIIIVRAHQPLDASVPSYSMRDTKDKFLPWDGNMASLVPFKTVDTPAEPIEVPIYSGQLDNPGVYHFYFGYRSAEGTVVYSQEGLEVIMTE